MKNLLILFAFFTSLTSCLSPRVMYIEDKDKAFCKDIITINRIIKSDKKIIDYFSYLNKDSLVFYTDSTLIIGFDQIIFNELASIRAENDSSEKNLEYYNDLAQEQKKYIKHRKEIKIECNIGKCVKADADLEITYWFEPTDRIYSVDIVNILKKPGYSKGYVLVIEKEAKEIEIIKRIEWTE